MLLVLPVDLAAPKLVGNGDQGVSGFGIGHKVNKHYKIPRQEHPKGQVERMVGVPGSGYEIGVASSGSGWWVTRAGPNRLLEREQQCSALGRGRWE